MAIMIKRWTTSLQLAISALYQFIYNTERMHPREETKKPLKFYSVPFPNHTSNHLLTIPHSSQNQRSRTPPPNLNSPMVIFTTFPTRRPTSTLIPQMAHHLRTRHPHPHALEPPYQIPIARNPPIILIRHPRDRPLTTRIPKRRAPTRPSPHRTRPIRRPRPHLVHLTAPTPQTLPRTLLVARQAPHAAQRRDTTNEPSRRDRVIWNLRKRTVQHRIITRTRQCRRGREPRA